MDKLRKIETPEFNRLLGYLSAAQHIFFKGELDISLEASLLEIVDPNISDEDVVGAVYDNFNPIAVRTECSVEKMIKDSELVLSSATGYGDNKHVRGRMEKEILDGYWQHLKSCIDYADARIVELGPDVPYVNIGQGFTFIIYSRDLSRCLLLIGNSSD